MSRASAKARGSAAERKVADWLAEHLSPYCERAPRWGSRDRGDITGYPRCAFEVKDEAAFEMAAAVDEALAEAANANADYGVVIRRRKGKPDPADWFVVLPLADLVRLLLEADGGQA